MSGSKFLFVTLAFIFFQMGCSTLPYHPENDDKGVTKQMDPPPNAVTRRTPTVESDYGVFSFPLGQYTLSEDMKNRILELFERANFNWSMNKVEIVSYADNILAPDGRTLSVADRKLAQRRADQIRAYLRKMYDITEVTVYNMAEQSNWVARNMNLNQDELTSIFAKEDMAPLTSDEFDIVKRNGFAGNVVIVISLKDRDPSE